MWLNVSSQNICLHCNLVANLSCPLSQSFIITLNQWSLPASQEAIHSNYNGQMPFIRLTQYNLNGQLNGNMMEMSSLTKYDCY